MKKLIVIVCLLSHAIFSIAQDQSQNSSIEHDSISVTSMFDLNRNAVYNEDLLIFCYERLLPINDHFGMTLKGGILIFDPFLPIMEVATVYGGSKHFMEAGIGTIIDPFSPDFSFLTLRAGYRYMAPKGFLFKLSPIYSPPDNFILPLVTLGYSF
jgi:hypothetical protein